MIAEDTAAFLADFGALCESGGRQARVIIDAPDNMVLGDRVQSSGYEITYRAADFPELAHGAWFEVLEGPQKGEYSVITPNAIDDAVFKHASLQRTRGQRP